MEVDVNIKLIGKGVVQKVIEKFMYDANQEADIASTGECFDEKIADAKYQLCKQIKESIDALEAKEVDLEKNIKEEYLKCRRYGGKDNMLVILNEPEFNAIAKYFFELGLNASNPLTWEDMMIIHKCCKDAMNYNLYAWETSEGKQKIYEDVLKRFKAQKG